MTMLHEKLRCNRSSTKSYLDKHSPSQCHDYLLQKSLENIKDLVTLLKENKKNDIIAYRIPEQILPQIDLGYYQIKELRKELKQVGGVANELGIQLSTHPSQYFVLNSMRKEVVERTIYCMNLFADIFEMMELDKVPNITLHVGMKKGYERVEEAIEAFCENFGRLNEAAKKYLVVENDHVSFTVEECMKIHGHIQIPVVFDNMHYKWNTGNLSYNEAVYQAVHTWGERIPKVHLSSDRDIRKHAHEEYVKVEDYLELIGAIELANIKECNVMLECKQKDKALLALRENIKV